MARVNVEEPAFGDPRLTRLAAKMGWSVPQALGHLVMLWHESQSKFATVGTSHEIAVWGWCDDDAIAARWVKALAATGYTTAAEPVGSGKWIIQGNEIQIEGIVAASSRAKKGGEANRRKWAERKERESSKLSPSYPQDSSNIAQYNAEQCNAEQSKAEQISIPSATTGGVARSRARVKAPPPAASACDLSVATDWHAFAIAEAPWLDGAAGITVEKFAASLVKLREAVGLNDDGIRALFKFCSTDTFWRSNALSPGGLLKKSKGGELRKIDHVLQRMKGATMRDAEQQANREAMEAFNAKLNGI